jgi:hypothetical protein
MFTASWKNRHLFGFDFLMFHFLGGKSGKSFSETKTATLAFRSLRSFVAPKPALLAR